MSSSQSLDPWLGRLVGDRHRYLLKKRLGSGGMGDVYLATDTLLGQPVALKLLNSRLANPELQTRFEREVALCAALRNDHIVRVSDYGITPDGYPFFVMEYLRGQTLKQLLTQEKTLSIERSISIINQVCAGLYPAHQGIFLHHDTDKVNPIKVTHRDLKPDNIFLLPTALGEFVKILDFGVAKLRSAQAHYTSVTSTFLGTFQYAAPEQINNEPALDERADIYSLGMILYEMLSGREPFLFGGEPDTRQTPSGVGWAMAHLSKPPIPLRLQPNCETLPEALETIVMRCLEKVPAQRLASVLELSQALQAMGGSSSNFPSAVPNLSQEGALPSPYLQEEAQRSQTWAKNTSISWETQPLDRHESLESKKTFLTDTNGQKIVAETIKFWTDNQPDLNHIIFQLLANEKHSYKGTTQIKKWIEKIIHTQLINQWQVEVEAEPLRKLQAQLLGNKACDPLWLLISYRKVLLLKAIDLDSSRELEELSRIGLILEKEGKLKVANRLYESIFNLLWVNQTLKHLRPYANKLIAWIDSDCQSKFYLLNKKELKAAQEWLAGKELDGREHRFLIDSMVWNS